MREANIGFILCYNLASKELRTGFLSSFLDRFYPVADLKIVSPIKGNKDGTLKFAGFYGEDIGDYIVVFLVYKFI